MWVSAYVKAEAHPGAGLPNVSWYMIPKLEKCTKRTQNVPNGHKISQMYIKYSKWT
jgi:hypothetical protein